MRAHRRTTRLVAPLLMVLVLVAAGCGGNGSDDGGAPSGGLTELGQKLPDDIKQSREVKVGSDIAYAPVEFFENGTELKGIDPDLADAMGEALGVRFTFVNTPFDGLIPALKSDRFDVIMSAMSVTPERTRELAFLEYFTVGTAIMVQKGNPQGIQDLDDLCGKTVALQRGTTQEGVAKDQKAKCEQQGSSLNLQALPSEPEALLRLKSGDSQANMNDYPVAAYNAQKDPALEVVGEQIDAGPYGIGIKKDATQLQQALKAALEAAVADGTYDRVLERWGVPQGALRTADLVGV